MRQIPTVSHYVSSYLANWRSDCSKARFLCQTKVIFGHFALCFQYKYGECQFLLCRKPLSLKRASSVNSHYNIPLRGKNVANWRSGCGMAHFFLCQNTRFSDISHYSSVGKREIPNFFLSGYPSRERVSFGHSPLNLGEKPGDAFQYSAKHYVIEKRCVF